MPFGTIQGYILPSALPRGIDEHRLHDILLRGASALGITRALCMVDFIISNQKVMLIEMTPRPGGDCLPHMLRECTGLDMLKTSLDFAAKLPLILPDTQNISSCVALRIHAQEEGILENIDCRRLVDDPRIKSIQLTRKPGHKIKLPPEDYDSWLLGHVIMNPLDQNSPEQEALAVLKKIEIFMEKTKVVRLLNKVRTEKPLIHNITNVVVTNFTANGLLALGASPVMAYAPEEVAEMAAMAGSLVLNIGTLNSQVVESMLIAGKAANEHGVPVILDPVGAGATAYRTETALKLLKELKARKLP